MTWHFKSHYEGTSDAEKDTAEHNEHAYSSKKNRVNVCLRILSCARNNATRIAPAQDTDHVDCFREIKVAGKTS